MEVPEVASSLMEAEVLSSEGLETVSKGIDILKASLIFPASSLMIPGFNSKAILPADFLAGIAAINNTFRMSNESPK